MARLSAKQRGDMRALERQSRLPQSNPVRGAGATPSTGLSQFRGGGYMDDNEQLQGAGAGDLTRLVGSGKKRGAHAMKMQELQDLHGAGFFDDFATGFKKGFNTVISPVAGLAKQVAPVFGPQGQAVSGVLGALGYGNMHGGAKKMNPKKIGSLMAQDIHQLHGAGFFDDFKRGFNSVIAPVAGIAKKVAPVFGPQGQAAAGVLGALGYGNMHELRKGGAMYPSGAYEGQGRLGEKGHGVLKIKPSRLRKPEPESDSDEDESEMEGGAKNKTHPVIKKFEMLIKKIMKSEEFDYDDAVEYYHDETRDIKELADKNAYWTKHFAKMSKRDSADRAKEKRNPSGTDGRKARAAIVKKVMQEQGLGLIAASKYVKANGLY